MSDSRRLIKIININPGKAEAALNKSIAILSEELTELDLWDHQICCLL